MNKEGRPFKGCLYFGLMITPNGPKVIEYNARFGDPEAQVVLPRLKTDLVDICEAVIDEKLSDLDIEWDNGAAACVVMASGGYPVSYKKGIEMFGLNDNGGVDGAIVYHAGTKYENGKFYTNGGRVLGVTATADTLDEAPSAAYAAVEKFPLKALITDTISAKLNNILRATLNERLFFQPAFLICSLNLSEIMAMNSLFVGLPLSL